MAYNNLKSEADELLDICWGKSSAANRLRKMANREAHIFRMSEKMTTASIMLERDKIPKKQRGKHPGKDASADDKYDWKWGEKKFQKNEGDIKNFSKELIAEIKKVLIKTAGADLMESTNSDEIKFSIMTTNPYQTLRGIKDTASKTIVNSKEIYKELFGQKDVAHIAHSEGIAVMKAGGAGNFWGDDNAQVRQDPPTEPIDTAFQKEMREVGLKAYNEKMTEMLPKLDIVHYTEANIKQGKLKGVKQVEADLDSSFHNEVIQANYALDGPYSEKEIGKHTKAAHVEAQKAIEAFYKKSVAKGEAEKEASISLLQNMRAMFFPAKIRKLAKRATIAKLKLKEPKSMRPRTAPAKKKVKPLKLKAKIHSTPISALGGLPKSKPRKRKGASESTTSMASLHTLLNAKLPQTVAENMGAPGLENRTGTFASSVRVTDVSQTAQGFPSVGYSYQKNPYQVFEVGRGTAPWATTARDPRTLIDASIREVAQQLAVGRFTTRRV